MNTRTPLIASVLLVASFISGTTHAALEGRDLNGSTDSFEAYYDTDLNITWLADANANGLMTWIVASTWAANLSFTDGVNLYDNWRLPTSDTSCWGFNCIGGEMGHLFYSELGGTAGQSILTSTDPDLAKFTNFQTGSYWSGTENASGNTYYAWLFFFPNGESWGYYKNSSYYALAVSDGDVGIAAVPEPETYAMMLAGLGLVGAAARLRRS